MSRAVEARLAKVKLDWTGCEDCRLAKKRTNQVWGRNVGEIVKGGMILLGEAPGKDEDLQGVPFVGRAGERLDETIQAAGIEQASIINPVLCRPPANRDPREDELQACFGRLQRTFEVLEPHVVLAMGRIAYFWLVEGKVLPTNKVFLKKIYEETPVTILEFSDLRFFVVPTYHPGYVLRKKRSRPIVVEHFRLARELMEVAI